MSKKIAWISILLVVLMSGCSLVPQFQSAREEYLETRVAELLEEADSEEEQVEVVEVAATEEALEEEEPEVTEEVEETEEAKEPKETEEVEEEPTAEATEEEAEATEEAEDEAEEEDEKSISTDPGVYLGEPDWEDDMSVPGNWPTTTNDFNMAAFDNESLMITALSESFGWRIASTDAVVDAYIEATFKVEDCSGKDDYGIIFRVPTNSNYNRGYLFGISCDGHYVLRSWGWNGRRKRYVDHFAEIH